MVNTTVWICPFCREEVARVEGFVVDYDKLEEDLTEHITSRHPVRRRLSRKTRRAFKQRRESY